MASSRVRGVLGDGAGVGDEGDPAAPYPDVGEPGGRAGPVHEGGALDEVVEHGGPFPVLVGGCAPVPAPGCGPARRSGTRVCPAPIRYAGVPRPGPFRYAGVPRPGVPVRGCAPAGGRRDGLRPGPVTGRRSGKTPPRVSSGVCRTRPPLLGMEGAGLPGLPPQTPRGATSAAAGRAWPSAQFPAPLPAQPHPALHPHAPKAGSTTPPQKRGAGNGATSRKRPAPGNNPPPGFRGGAPRGRRGCSAVSPPTPPGSGTSGEPDPCRSAESHAPRSAESSASCPRTAPRSAARTTTGPPPPAPTACTAR